MEQRELARMLGLGVDDLDSLERGAARLEGAILYAAAKALGVDSSFFFKRPKRFDRNGTIAMLDWRERRPSCLNDNFQGVGKPRSRAELTIVDAKSPPGPCS